MPLNLNIEENIILQSYSTIVLLAELQNNNFLSSKYFKNLKFKNTSIKKLLPQISIGNIGTVFISLYSLLAIPKELDYINPVHRKTINAKIDNLCTYTKSNYSKDKPYIDHIRHIRNAISHMNVNFINSDSLFIFNDKKVKYNKKSRTRIFTYTLKISNTHIESIINLLQENILDYFKAKQTPNS